MTGIPDSPEPVLTPIRLMSNSLCMDSDPDLIGSKEACRILRDCARSTLTRYVHDGRLEPAAKLHGRNGAYLFRRGEVDRLLAELTTEEVTS